MANEKRLSFLAEKYLAALGTFLVGGKIPRRKIALGVFFTAVKYRLVSAVLHNYLRAALGTRNTDVLCLLLREVTLGVFDAGKERSEFTRTLNHIRTALFALEVGNYYLFLGNLCIFLTLFGSRCNEGLGVLTLGVVGTSRKLTEASVLDYHYASALVTDDIGLLCGYLKSFCARLLVSRA